MFVKLTYHDTESVVYVNLSHIIKMQVSHTQGGQEYLTISLVDGNQFNVNENSAQIAEQGERFGLNIFGR